MDDDGGHGTASTPQRRRCCSRRPAAAVRRDAAACTLRLRRRPKWIRAWRELLRERRTLWLRRGNEELRATYWTAAQGRNQDEYLHLCWILRDVQADRVFAMNRALLDTLAGIQAWLKHSGVDAPIELHSGYRTRRTNLATEGAALNSRHVVGQAADISVPGVSNVKLAGMSSVLGRGGTGFYVGRGFVHVDTGNERIWIDQKSKASRPAG